ncbi:gluconate 2-dehydrogenase subunit 3 family protein [Burkholderia sp. L27(2015)]|uniref:gluconate 2-dehydrogenase subunit 3 family protein n=1 Tax=Burkholderia sp. L27(2015) TaxID=1641858 RepID=UPI00131B179F|nr:gluconate 2-dehydrogenase subunit 3 family protein [Burkholderia sp. L27(2015)]
MTEKSKSPPQEVPQAQVQASRRSFLFKSVAILPAAGALAGCDVSTSGNAAAATSAADTTPYQTRYFTADEWRFIEAAVDRLIPADAEGPGALELNVAVFIDRQMDSGFGHASTWYMQGPFHPDAPALSGYQSPLTPRELYRAGIASLNEYCKAHFSGKSFMELTPADQDKLFHGMDGGTVKLEHVSAGKFFALLLQNTKEGYLADPIHGGNKGGGSWKMIGFPGARADYLDWVAQPGKVYPLGTVTIADAT